MKLQVPVARVREDAHVPRYASEGAAGLDLFACTPGPIELAPGEISLIPTGLAMAIPTGYVGLVRDRSGLALTGLHTVAGVIDPDYRGEVMVAVRNGGPAVVMVEAGQRVAQLLVLPCPQVQIQETHQLPPTSRGAGGFGSTGR